MPTPSKYNSAYHDDWAWSLAAQGATDEEIAEAFKISVRTLHRWKKDYEKFAEALATGKEVADAKVEKSLYRRALGYEAKDVDQTVDTDPMTGKVTITKQRIVTKHVPPDTMAIMYWLNNRTKNTGKWSQQQKVELSGSVGTVDLSKVSDDDLEKLTKLAEAIEDASQDGDKK